MAESHVDVDLQTLEAALLAAAAIPLQIRNIFTGNSSVSTILRSSEHVCSWRLTPLIISVTRLILDAGSPRLNVIPRIWLNLALEFAMVDRNLHTLSLFHSGRDLPQWLMRSIVDAGFVFH